MRAQIHTRGGHTKNLDRCIVQQLCDLHLSRVDSDTGEWRQRERREDESSGACQEGKGQIHRRG